MLPVANARSAFASWCGSRRETRVVPSITLETAIGLLGPDLPISVLKIDAQGVDFKLLKAAPRELVRRRVETIQMETRSPTCPLLYEGQSTCDEVYEYMTSLGYAVRGPGRMRENRGCPPGLNADKTACSISTPLYNCCEQNVAYGRPAANRLPHKEKNGTHVSRVTRTHARTRTPVSVVCMSRAPAPTALPPRTAIRRRRAPRGQARRGGRPQTRSRYP